MASDVHTTPGPGEAEPASAAVLAVSSTGAPANGTATHTQDSTGRTGVAVRRTNSNTAGSTVSTPATSNSQRAGLSGVGSGAGVVTVGDNAPTTAATPVNTAAAPVATSSLRRPGTATSRAPVSVPDPGVPVPTTPPPGKAATAARPAAATSASTGPAVGSVPARDRPARRSGTTRPATASAIPPSPPRRKATGNAEVSNRAAPNGRAPATTRCPVRATGGASKAEPAGR